MEKKVAFMNNIVGCTSITEDQVEIRCFWPATPHKKSQLNIRDQWLKVVPESKCEE